MTGRPPLCALADIPDPGAREFRALVDGEKRRVFVVRRGDQVWGYVNSCPHIGAPLNLEDDKFLDITQTSILCANHFALFEMESGLCTRGPCNGRRLAPFAVEVIQGQLVQKG